ncbi:YusW family protein [Alkalicoccus daliensis]|uniref:YusW-like protein n=1 Tax=Alkalicoccus daliensis TaxID=745820 RepID=A0A1H0EVX4_9BACI|nr:YusW family protein [Alkalicoccus daliensis]SDN86520.1 YusW-like protein [Alkalicoccus daliensis]
MKKLITGVSALTLLAACGLNEVSPEENNTESVADTQTEADSGESAQDNIDETNAAETSASDEQTENSAEVSEFDLQIEFTNSEEWEFEYERDDYADTEIERDGKETVTGEEAAAEIEAVLEDLHITAGRPVQEIKDEVLEVLGLSTNDVQEFDLDIEFDTGESIVLDHETSDGDRGAVKELDLDIDFANNEDLEFEFDADDQEAEIERRDGSEIEGAEALEEIEALLESISIAMDRSIADMKAEVLQELDLDEDEVSEFNIDVTYENNESVKFKHDTE